MIGTVEIDRQRKVASLDVLEEERRTAKAASAGVKGLGIVAQGWGLRECQTIGDLSDLKNWGHRRLDPVEFPGRIELGDEGAKVRHVVIRLAVRCPDAARCERI